ncbi:MAG: tetratricopeptide repeat protein, partial [Pseudomonadota bacterium]
MKYWAALIASLFAALTLHGPLQAEGVGAESTQQQGPAADPAFAAAIEAAKSAIMADPEQGLIEADKALDLAGKQTSNKLMSRAEALWLKAEALIGLNRLEEAGDVATEALEIAQKEAPGSKLHGDLLRSRGGVRALSGNVQDALADYLQAHDIFRDAKNARGQAIALQDIGLIYWEAGDYERTLRYYAQ